MIRNSSNVDDFLKVFCYNKKTDTVRTDKINSVFLCIARHQKDLEHKKSGILFLNFEYSALVAPLGIEPRSKV